MENKKLNNIKLSFILTYFIGNIINTYFLTTQLLNRYISPFRHTFIGELNAILGNFAILLLFVVVINLIFRKVKSKMIALTSVTLVLNLFIFALGFFTLFYGTAFATNALDIFKNPAEGISHGMFTVVLHEIFIYFRILVFVPFVALLIITRLYYKEARITNTNEVNNFKLKPSLTFTLLFVITMFISTYSFQSRFKKSDLPLGSTVSTFAVQNYGVYPFYTANLFGIDFDVTSRSSMDLDEDQELLKAFDRYNKNKTSYQNIIDSKYYSNELYYNQTNNLEISTLNSGDLVNGIFKGKNLVLVHLESINSFLFELEETRARMPFVNELLKESYHFNNYYTSVGMGVSSDAEITVLTGLYPNGHSTLYWDYNDLNFEFDTLPKLFGKKDYQTMGIHGDYEKFYNRDVAYPNFLGFNEPYQSLEKFAEDANMTLKEFQNHLITEGVSGHKSPWVSDLELSRFVTDSITKYNNQNLGYFMFNVHTMPHTPFQFNPYKDTPRVEYDKWDNKISSLTRNYIDYVDYFDETVKKLFIDDEGNNITDTNTVYVFYSDHGSSLKNGDLNILFDKGLHLMEERMKLQQVTAFIYAPSDDLNESNINKGIIKGVQPLVRGHVDLYRTIVDLFDLYTESNFYFGVNGLSDEPTFVIDNRIQDLIVDNPSKNNSYIVSLRNRKNIFPLNTTIDHELLNDIIYFKELSDLLLNDVETYKTLKRLYK